MADAPGDFCACCRLHLMGRGCGKRFDCDVCERPVCAACSTSTLQPAGADAPYRVCSKCVEPVEQARPAKERLAKLDRRLRALSMPTPQRQSSVLGRRDGWADRSIVDAVAMVEASVCQAEESLIAAKAKVDSSAAAAAAERIRREEVVAKAADVKASAAQIGLRISEAREQCDACVRPLHSMDAASKVDADRWAVSLNVDRASTERRLAEAEAEVRRGRDLFFQLATRLNDLMHPISGEPMCPKPAPTHGMDDLARLCERAVRSISEMYFEDDRMSIRSRSRSGKAMSMPAQDRSSERGSKSLESFGTLSTSLPAKKLMPSGNSRGRDPMVTRSQSALSAASIPSSQMSARRVGANTDACSSCAAALGFRHCKPRQWCEVCRESFCAACVTKSCLCDNCRTSSRHGGFYEPLHQDDRVVRMKKLHETLRNLAPQGSRRRSSKHHSLDELITSCEAATQPLKDMKAGHELAMALAQDVRRHLQRSAESTKNMLDASVRLTMDLNDGRPLGHASPSPPRSPSPPPARPQSDPSSLDFWDIRDPNQTAACV